jgi:hypothetical protein
MVTTTTPGGYISNNMGWECPKCGRCFGPHVNECFYCVPATDYANVPFVYPQPPFYPQDGNTWSWSMPCCFTVNGQAVAEAICKCKGPGGPDTVHK